jgi:membrane-associated phospholipid phosphatase
MRATVPSKPAVARWRGRLAAPAVVIGLLILAIGMVVVRNGNVPAWERSVFHAINDLPGVLYRPLWPFQQLGALAIGPIVALVAVVLRRFRLAAAVVTATVLKLVLERVVKLLASRQRPGSGVHLRGDVSAAGESFVSGHAVLVTAIAVLVTPYLAGRWKVVPWVIVALVMITRVYVGAHNPLDVLCGAGLGLAIGGAINIVLGARAGGEPQ